MLSTCPYATWDKRLLNLLAWLRGIDRNCKPWKMPQIDQTLKIRHLHLIWHLYYRSARDQDDWGEANAESEKWLKVPNYHITGVFLLFENLQYLTNLLLAHSAWTTGRSHGLSFLARFCKMSMIYRRHLKSVILRGGCSVDAWPILGALRVRESGLALVRLMCRPSTDSFRRLSPITQFG